MDTLKWQRRGRPSRILQYRSTLDEEKKKIRDKIEALTGLVGRDRLSAMGRETVGFQIKFENLLSKYAIMKSIKISQEAESKKSR